MSKVYFKKATKNDLSNIVSLQEKWVKEDIVYGFAACSLEVLKQFEIWCCISDDSIIGYISGKQKTSDDMCIIPIKSKYFEIEDFYIIPEKRSEGIGEKFYKHVELELKSAEITHILLSSATKDAERIRKFYIDKAGFDIWTTVFFKVI